MKTDKNVIILKLGGSVITDKNEPLSFRDNVVERIIDEIIKSKKKVILVHGGGSFGHPLAEKYDIIGGFNPKIENQLYGLAETHNSMINLNNKIIKKFRKRKIPVMSLHPSSMFIYSPELRFSGNVHLEILLNLGIIPILYGDIVFKKNKEKFSVISGDKIILEICRSLKNYRISNVIFSIEEDGLYGYIKDERKNDNTPSKFIEKISSKNLQNLVLAKLEKKIDVTGGISKKLLEIKQICNLDIPVMLLNGLKEKFILKALMGKLIPSTIIRSSKKNEFNY
ncbi:MAG: isopentenyl phosphate kinase [Promethearchaeota archaeon]